MTIRKSRRQDVSNSYVVTGREFMHLDCTLPNGDAAQIDIQIGTQDVNGREYIAIDCLFDPKSNVEFSQPMPQQVMLIIRTPKHE